MRVRRYQDEDRDAVVAVGRRLVEGVAPWRDAAGVRRAVHGWIRDAIAAHGRDAAVVYVAEIDGAIAGFVSASERGHFSGQRDAYIGELAVQQDFEGRGVARELVAAAELWATSRGHERVTLETGFANVRARRFYAELGYETEEVQLTKLIPPP